MKDPIVEEVRKGREEHAARFNYDMDAIFEDLKRLEKASGHVLVNLKPKRIVHGGKKAVRDAK
jgi:hypothetical protein